MQKRKGISLIVLVITIIVMIILAGAIILTLNNSGIINKASNAVEETNLATVKEVASLAWAEAYAEGLREPADIEEYILDGLTEAGVKIEDYTITVTETGVDVIAKNNNIAQNNIVPEGAVYIMGSANDYMWTTGERLLPGDTMPETVEVGHVYYYGDYVYIYGGSYTGGAPSNITDESFGTIEYIYMQEDYGGWHVHIIDPEKTEYGEILSNINGKDVTDMEYTFIKNYASAKVVVAPKIPDSVTHMGSTFYGCTSLQTAPTIPDSVTYMMGTFSGCTSLQTAPAIPSKVMNISGTFSGCTSLTGTIEINTNPTYYDNCLAETQITGVTGTTTLKTEILATK